MKAQESTGGRPPTAPRCPRLRPAQGQQMLTPRCEIVGKAAPLGIEKQSKLCFYHQGVFIHFIYPCLVPNLFQIMKEVTISGHLGGSVG